MEARPQPGRSALPWDVGGEKPPRELTHAGLSPARPPAARTCPDADANRELWFTGQHPTNWTGKEPLPSHGGEAVEAPQPSYPLPAPQATRKAREPSRRRAQPDRAVQSRSSELARSLCLTESGRFPLRLPAGFPAPFPQRDERFLPVGTRFPPISHQRPRAPSQGVWPSVFCHVVLRKS